MTHYSFIALMPKQFWNYFFQHLDLTKIPYQERELRVYEIAINNENEKQMDKFLEDWNNEALPIPKMLFKLLYKKHKIKKLEPKKSHSNMRSIVFKFRKKHIERRRELE